jgi:isoleucyl-tRNA synthetase
LSELDHWILARLNQVIARVTECMEDYDPYGATLVIEPLLDDLTNWYVRRSRRRFWKSERDADKDAAYATLYHVLVTLCKLLAPMVPFVTEVMYQNLTRSVDIHEAKEDEHVCKSIHHCSWPEMDESAVDEELLDRMALAIQIASLGRSARSTSGIKLRQPLARARVYAGGRITDLGSLADLVIDELNVKALEFVVQEADLVEYEIGLLPNLLGPKHGKRFPLLRRAVAADDAGALAKRFRADLSATFELSDGGPALELLPEEVKVRTHGREGYALAEEKGIFVAVDVDITPDLAREGLARDMVRRIQMMRKEADYQLNDRIATYCDGDDELHTVVREWGDYIQAETLSLELMTGSVPDDVDQTESFELEGHPLKLGIKKT